MRAQRRETAQDRIGDGTAKAVGAVFQPDAAANEVLDSLIDQIRELPWPRTNGGDSRQ